jgi:hypothetical protein
MPNYGQGGWSRYKTSVAKGNSGGLAGSGESRRERGLAAKRVAAQVIPIQLDQIKGVEEDAVVWSRWRMRSNDEPRCRQRLRILQLTRLSRMLDTPLSIVSLIALAARAAAWTGVCAGEKMGRGNKPLSQNKKSTPSASQGPPSAENRRTSCWCIKFAPVRYGERGLLIVLKRNLLRQHDVTGVDPLQDNAENPSSRTTACNCCITRNRFGSTPSSQGVSAPAFPRIVILFPSYASSTFSPRACCRRG